MYTHHTCAWYPRKPGDGVEYPGAGVFRSGITPGTPGRAASTLNCGSITPAPLVNISKALRTVPSTKQTKI